MQPSPNRRQKQPASPPLEPGLPEWPEAGRGFEYISRTEWLGYPLVHIAFGTSPDGRLRTAKGIIAIGQRACGLIAIGILSMGGLAIGIASLGVVSLGIAAIGAGAAFGCNAIAPFAIGIVGIGWWAGGLSAFGWKILF